jgi:CheY-like chemotaxis protein
MFSAAILLVQNAVEARMNQTTCEDVRTKSWRRPGRAQGPRQPESNFNGHRIRRLLFRTYGEVLYSRLESSRFSFTGDRTGLRILIVDDHTGFRQAVRQILGSSGKYQVCGEAANGQEAVAQALQLRPNLIILDISMPVMDGLSAAKRLKALLPDIPILMLSSFQEMGEASQEVGAQGFILKMEIADVLIEAVDRLFGGQTFFTG